MNHPTSNLSHVGHTIALNQSCKFEPDWSSHMGAYMVQSTGSRPHKPSSLARFARSAWITSCRDHKFIEIIRTVAVLDFGRESGTRFRKMQTRRKPRGVIHATSGLSCPSLEGAASSHDFRPSGLTAATNEPAARESRGTNTSDCSDADAQSLNS